MGVAKMRGWRRRAWYPLFAHALVCLGIPRLRLFLVHGRVTIRHQTTPLKLQQLSMCDEDEFESVLKYALECTASHGMSPKPEQVTAIRAVYDQKDVFVWLPTGFGKLLCYETIPFIYDWKLRRVDYRSLVLVVSPLVALMIDQVKSLRKRNVKAAIISGGSGGAFGH